MHFLLPLKSDKSDFCAHRKSAPRRRVGAHSQLKTKPLLQFTNENTLHLCCCEFPRYTRSRQSENYEAPGPIRAVCVDVKSGGNFFFFPLQVFMILTDATGKKGQNRSKPCGAMGPRVRCEKQSLVLFKPPDLSVPRFCHCQHTGWQRERLLCTYCVLTHSQACYEE